MILKKITKQHPILHQTGPFFILTTEFIRKKTNCYKECFLSLSLMTHGGSHLHFVLKETSLFSFTKYYFKYHLTPPPPSPK